MVCKAFCIDYGPRMCLFSIYTNFLCRSRKAQQPEFDNGHIESNQDTTLRVQSESMSPSYGNSNATIPPNKGGKRYNMNEVFQVWYENKDQILDSNLELPVQNNENYKLSKPGQIYHLDLQPSGPTNNSQESYNGSASEIIESLDKLSTAEGMDFASQMKSQGPPPGMNLPNYDSQSDYEQPSGQSQLALLTSDKIEWFYVDPSGNEQGPFIGDMMQEWLTDGYLNLDLKIRRKEERNYQTLKELCDKVQNYIQPFKVPLPDLSNVGSSVSNDDQSSFTSSGIQPSQSQFQQFLGGPSNLGVGNMRLNSSINPQSNLFGNDFINHHNDPFSSPLTPLATSAFSNPNQFGIDSMNSGIGFNHSQPLSNPLQHINNMPSLLLQQNSVLSSSNSGWGIDPQNGRIGSTPGTPVSVAPVLPSQMSQAPMSPWLSGVQSLSRVSSPFVPSSTLANSEKQGSSEQPSPNQNHSNQHDAVLDGIHTSVVTDILNDGEEESTESAVDQQKQKQKQQKQQKQATQQNKTVLQKEKKSDENKVPYQSHSEAQQVLDSKANTDSKNVSTLPVESSVHEDNEPKSTNSQPILAPWASVTSTNQDSNTKPALTLKEIQMVEAERVKEQKQIEAAIKNEQLSKAKLEEKPVEEKPSLPKASSWGVNANSKPVVAKKTLAEIQREEFEAAKAKAKAANVLPVASTASKSSFANALANSVPKDDSPWTVVTPKKPLVKKPSQSTISTTTTPASKANPQLLRSVSAVKPLKSTANSMALKEEFLIWARSSMTNLYPTVSKDDLLDIFTTLPLNNDSSQLISETIYSSSATMDGRRFAQEFLKRRQKVEQQIGAQDEVSWGSAIISSADKVSTIDEEGWSTSVKSKKKNKKF
ncbi:unnamed protein product [Debaryomyces fabryi]|nr:unnamed protein product [Debaryomyces fabryi]